MLPTGWKRSSRWPELDRWPDCQHSGRAHWRQRQCSVQRKFIHQSSLSSRLTKCRSAPTSSSNPTQPSSATTSASTLLASAATTLANPRLLLRASTTTLATLRHPEPLPRVQLAQLRLATSVLARRSEWALSSARLPLRSVLCSHRQKLQAPFYDEMINGGWRCTYVLCCMIPGEEANEKLLNSTFDSMSFLI